MSSKDKIMNTDYKHLKLATLGIGQALVIIASQFTH